MENVLISFQIGCVVNKNQPVLKYHNMPSLWSGKKWKSICSDASPSQDQANCGSAKLQWDEHSADIILQSQTFC
jgi:hypothetical protein